MLTEKEKQDKFLTLFLPLQKRLERFVLVKCHDEIEAKDITGETILIAYERFETLSSPQAFLSFLFTIALRIYHQRRSRSERFDNLEEYRIENLLDPEASPEVKADIEILSEAINTLPIREREELILFEILGLSMKEIIAIHGGTVVALKVRLMRSRSKLKKMLHTESAKIKRPLKTEAEGSIYQFARSERL
jgi:RNA polymerase sigma-70 factor (ECF subfamily)